MHGEAVVPGDKSIGHRALMLAALARGTSEIRRVPEGEDVLSTAACVGQLGIDVRLVDGTAYVHSGMQLSAPRQELDAGNSGTTMRLLSGILAGQAFTSRLTGDASLRRRPMGRVVDPLRLMGAEIGTMNGSAPLEIVGSALRGIHYTLPVASAQVKSAVLLAGLFATGQTRVTEIIPARDHTERMLTALGYPVERTGDSVTITSGHTPGGFAMTVPGDISSAAFLFAAAALTGGEVTVDELGLNPTRTAVLQVLERMGASVTVSAAHEEMGEPRGTTCVRGPIARPIHVGAPDVPALVDELPLIALLATQAPGVSVIEGAHELRLKETDRIASVARELSIMGADIEERTDGWRIRGGARLRGSSVQSHGDHRLAMLLAVAGATAEGDTLIDDAEASAVSFPDFPEVFASLGGIIEAA